MAKQKQITIPGFIYAGIPESWATGDANVIDGVSYRFSIYDSPAHTKVARLSLVFDAPTKDQVVAGFVATLEAEKEKRNADHQNAITDLNRRIQQYLAITCEAA